MVSRQVNKVPTLLFIKELQNGHVLVALTEFPIALLSNLIQKLSLVRTSKDVNVAPSNIIIDRPVFVRR